MNEKDLNFRHLIKTFTPGFFASISFLCICDLVMYKFLGKGYEWTIFTNALSNPLVFVAALIPASMFLGIIVNTFCYVYMFTVIENFKKKSESGITFRDFKDKMSKMMKNHYSEHFVIDKKDEFDLHFEEKSFLLHRQDISNYQSIKSGYFYYLEFQLNAIIVIIFSLASLGLNLFLRNIQYIGNENILISVPLGSKIIFFMVIFIISSLVCLLLCKAILKNDTDYEKKELSYLLGAFHICKSKGSKLPI